MQIQKYQGRSSQPDYVGFFAFMLRMWFRQNPAPFIIAFLLFIGGAGIFVGFRHPVDQPLQIQQASVADVSPVVVDEPTPFVGEQSSFVDDETFIDGAITQPVPMPKPKKKAAPVNVDPEGFIKQWAPIAKTLSRKGVPASIILAQAMLESRCGTSSLAVNANNFFGHKCFEKHCKKGHCLNYSDDTHKDFFRVYKNPSTGFSEHAVKITSGRYASLKKYGRDYRQWAYGLKSKGYATDRRYATSLIGTIERYKLYRFDK